MTTPIEAMLNAVEWTEVGKSNMKDVGDGDIPYVTHEGALDLYGVTLRVYQLSNGKRIVDAEDIARLGRDAALDASKEQK